MTLHEKLKYYPVETDVIVYLDGKSYRFDRDFDKHYVVLVTLCSNRYPALKAKPIAHVRQDLIQGLCYVCRKPDKK